MRYAVHLILCGLRWFAMAHGVSPVQDYIPVEQEELRDYVKARLKVFYEEELDVPLVLFNEVLDHVLRIDR